MVAIDVRPVVLSGGSGTRLWPMSRELYPKQLLPLLGDETLLQATVTRLEGVVGARIAAPYVVCNHEYRFLIAEQLRQIERPAAALILEPVGRNTAPALTLAALHARGDGQDPVLVVMPADHLVGNLHNFQAAMAEAITIAATGRVATFSVVPDRPETGYGYIEAGAPFASSRDARVLKAFVEKPDLERAQAYVASGNFGWNSGLFVVRASVWIAAIAQYRPDIHAACEASLAGVAVATDGFVHLNGDAFRACPSDSIDYAVMERIAGDAGGAIEGVVVPLDAAWSDVGAWDALWRVAAKDTAGNVVRGNAMLHDARNTLVMAEDRLVTCVGVDDMVVVETADAVLVAHRERTQEVKEIVSRLKAEKRSEASSHRKVYRPWGSFDSIDRGDRFQVKRIVVNPGAAISLQMHHHRAEHWIVVRGTAKVTRGDEVVLVSENQSTYIPLGMKHRLENPGKVPLEIIEVQSGSYLGEDDIVRFEDTYGRS